MAASNFLQRCTAFFYRNPIESLMVRNQNAMHLGKTFLGAIFSAIVYSFSIPCLWNRQNRLKRFVYTHFKSCDQSLDKTSFDLSSIFRAMQSYAMCAKSSIMLKLLKSG